MATAQQVQDQIDLTRPTCRITQCSVIGTTTEYYVVGGQAPHAGKAKWIQTVTADTAATQAAAILAALVL